MLPLADGEVREDADMLKRGFTKLNVLDINPDGSKLESRWVMIWEASRAFSGGG